MPSAPEPKAQGHSISLQMFTIITTIIIIMQNRNSINFILHHIYYNLMEYCNIVNCGTLCKWYYN